MLEKIDICANIFDYVNEILPDYFTANKEAMLFMRLPKLIGKKDYAPYIAKFKALIEACDELGIEGAEYDEDDESVVMTMEYFERNIAAFKKICQINVEYMEGQNALSAKDAKKYQKEMIEGIGAEMNELLNDFKADLHCVNRAAAQLDKELVFDYDPDSDDDLVTAEVLAYEHDAMQNGTYMTGEEIDEADDLVDSRVDPSDYVDIDDEEEGL